MKECREVEFIIMKESKHKRATIKLEAKMAIDELCNYYAKRLSVGDITICIQMKINNEI